MVNKFSGSLVGSLVGVVLAALFFVSGVNAQSANEGGFLGPYTSGAVVVVDMDRDSMTTYTVRADYRVPSVVITFHLKDGTDVEGTTDQYGAAHFDISTVASISAVCPPIAGHYDTWVCADNVPVYPGVRWTAVIIQPLITFFPMVIR